MMREFIVMLAGAGLVSMSSTRLDAARLTLPAHLTEEQEALTLPRGELLTALTFGYRLVVADVLWFNTISYFGKHYGTDKRYRWLAHMCDLVTTLNPTARHVYMFGATMLAWEGNSPRDAVTLLTKAIQHIPNDWELYYLRGFTEMYFLENRERAHHDFVTAARLPGAHVLVQRLAARELSELSGPDEAERFLEDILQVTSDPAARRALQVRLREIREKRK